MLQLTAVKDGKDHYYVDDKSGKVVMNAFRDFNKKTFYLGADGWRTARGMVVVPPGTDSFVVKMSADKLNGVSSAWFDDIHIYRLW